MLLGQAAGGYASGALRLILISTVVILAVTYAVLVLLRLLLFRKRQKEKTTSWSRRLLQNLAVAVPLTLLLLPVVLGFAGSRLVHTRLDEAAYQGPRFKADGTWELQNRETLAKEPRAAKPRHAIRLESTDGLELRAFLVPSRVNPPTARVVLVHGLFRGAVELEPVARMFWQLGAEVLMLELRNHGGSQRAPATYGLRESRDVLAAAHFMQQHQPVCPLILFGVSLGTAAVALAAPKIQDLAGLVLDAPMTDLEGAARRVLQMPGPLTSAVLWFIEAWSGFSMDDIHVDREVSKLGAQVQVLVIGAGLDHRCPPAVVRKVYESVSVPEDHKELWILEGAHHGHVWRHDAAGYRRRLERLLERCRR